MCLGNILEYYDFLLFSHLGIIITPIFFPQLTSLQTHILSLVLFGIPFLIRPVGDAIFGKIADTKGRKTALIESIKWSVIPAFGFALLPDFSVIGYIGSCLFIILRLCQGFALGGEYPMAGLYLMELSKNNRGLLSSIFATSVPLGSLLGLGFAALCSLPEMPVWFWRIGFLIGGTGSILSYFMRKELIEIKIDLKIEKNVTDNNMKFNCLLVFVTSILISICMWIPATYSNFFVTKILKESSNKGFYASFIYLVFFLIALPIVGIIYDIVGNYKKYMLFVTLLICPISILSILLLTKSYIFLAQIGFVINTALVGAPIHALMHQLFPTVARGKNVGIFFMAGLSVGGIAPSILSYLVSKTELNFVPAFLACSVSLIVFLIYNKARDLKF